MKKYSMGFTLVELMIVIAIIGILAAVGYPAYINSTNKANRGDAISGLVALSKRMEEYYNDNDTYVGATVNVTGTGTVGSSKTTDDLYTLSITTATLFAYSLTATPKKANSECSTLTYDSLGVKGSTGTEATCW